jgi:hypothetical protein
MATASGTHMAFVSVGAPCHESVEDTASRTMRLMLRTSIVIHCLVPAVGGVVWTDRLAGDPV